MNDAARTRFAIGLEERDQRMRCMIRAMEDADIEPGIRRGLAQAFFQTADWTRNKSVEPGRRIC